MAWLIRIPVFLLLLGGLGAVSFFFLKQEREAGLIDPNTFCNSAVAPEQMVTIAIDSSDPFTTIQMEAIRTALGNLIDELPAGGLVEIYRMNASQGELTDQLFSACNPGEDISVGELFATTSWEEDELRSRYPQRFVGAIRDTLDREANSQAADRSYIIESIHAISVQSFAAHTGAAANHSLGYAPKLRVIFTLSRRPSSHRCALFIEP